METCRLSFPVFLVLLDLLVCSAVPDLSSGDRQETSGNHIQHEFVHVPSRLEDESHLGVETHYVYMNLKKSASLQCSSVDKSSLPQSFQNESQDAVKWFKTLPQTETSGKRLIDLSQKCEDDPEPDDDEDSKGPKCYFVYSPVKNSDSRFYSTLRIRRIERDDYGSYDCRVNGKVVRRFILRGELRAVRKYKTKGHEKETEHSVIVEVDKPLHLYCNYTEAESDNYIDISNSTYNWDYVGVTWFKLNGTHPNDTLIWEDITTDLRNPESGTFLDFNETLPNQFLGIANHSHRGDYICSVNVLRPSDAVVHEKMFPVEYKFKVRVQDPHRWMTPGGILLAEILCMGIFTAIIWKRDDSKEVDNDAAPQDSDDSDNGEEESPKLK